MKFKKMVLAAALFASAAFCANAYASDVLNFKLGFVDPANSSYAQGGQKFADELAKLTDGKIKVQVVAGGTLGGEREMYEGAQMGTMDMITVVNTVLSQFIPEAHGGLSSSAFSTLHDERMPIFIKLLK